VPGIELSCAADGRSVHLLGYLFDADEPVLAGERRRLATDRERRARAMVARLTQLGVAVAWDRVAELAGDGTIGRPHVAQAMVELGVVPDVSSAFTAEWLARGGRAYVEKYVLDPARAIELVHRAGGVTVVAHPSGPDLVDAATVDRLIEQLAEAGLSGVEVEHPSHDAAARLHLRALASRLGLVATGSSDYHGSIKPVDLGANLTDPAAYDALIAPATGATPITG
jgi:predicted metal-dependent phosphoesterase TrpH